MQNEIVDAVASDVVVLQDTVPTDLSLAQAGIQAADAVRTMNSLRESVNAPADGEAPEQYKARSEQALNDAQVVTIKAAADLNAAKVAVM